MPLGIRVPVSLWQRSSSLWGAGCLGTQACALGTYSGFGLARDLLYCLAMRDTLCRCLAIVGAILAACFILHVLRFVTISAETRGVCAGVVGCLVGGHLLGVMGSGRASARRRKR